MTALKKLEITDNNLKNIMAQGKKEFPLQYYVDELEKYPGRMVPLHWHPELEFYVVRGCPLLVRLGQAAVTVNVRDGIFINANVFHSFAQQEIGKSVHPNVVFSHELLAPYGSIIYQKYFADILHDEEIPYILLKKECGWQNEILELLDKVFSLLQRYSPASDFYGEFPQLPFQYAKMQSPCYEMDVVMLLSAIWKKIYGNRLKVQRFPLEKNNQLLQVRIQKMTAFMQEHYSRTISLKEIADAADISKSEASRCFQSYMHTSPVRYLMEYRLETARKLLQQSDAAITAIADECGFETASYFCKIFKREMGMTPLQYRNGD